MSTSSRARSPCASAPTPIAMKAGDYVCFPAGQKAGHCLINDSGAPCRYVIVGERNPNEVAVYTDSNKVLVRALGRRAIFDLAARRGYWDGENTGLPPGQACRPMPRTRCARRRSTPKPPISSHRRGMGRGGSARGHALRRPLRSISPTRPSARTITSAC